MADVALAAWEAWATVSQAGYGGLATRRGWWAKPAQQPTTVVTNSQTSSLQHKTTATTALACEEQVLHPHCNWLITVGRTFDRCGC